MKVLTYAASSMLLGRAVAETLHFTETIVGMHLHNYEQRGNAVECKDDADVDADLRETGGKMDFASDSVEMCAQVCDCRQGCVSFSWVKPDGFDGAPAYVLPPGTNNVGDQGKCSLHTSDCTESNQVEASAVTYSWAKRQDALAKLDGTPTDVRAKYPRTGDANEQEVTDQVACVLDGVSPVDGYVMIGGGGAFPGVCVSGGGTAKLTDLDLATGGTVEKCREICDNSAECEMFNIGTSGICKFRTQRCQTSWVTGTTQAYTTYIKGEVTMPPTSAPSIAPSAGPPQGAVPVSPVNGGGEDQAFSGSIASSTAATALAAALALALVY